MDENKTGWQGVFTIYPIRKLGKGCMLPGIMMIFSVGAYFFSEADALSLMQKVSDFITSGFPSIIGFVLTGYALLIGFSGTELFGGMARSSVDNKDHSYFQLVNSIFAVVLGVVVLTYIVGCVVGLVISMEIEWPFSNGYKCFNNIVFFVFLFLFYYSIFALVDIIVNIFNIGQYANAVAQNKNITEEKSKKKPFIIRVLRYIFSSL